MVYTTGGMRCARISVVDGTGTEVFDELVRMDDGVEIMYVDLWPIGSLRRSDNREQRLHHPFFWHNTREPREGCSTTDVDTRVPRLIY